MQQTRAKPCRAKNWMPNQYGIQMAPGKSVMTVSMLLLLEFITQQEEFLTPSFPVGCATNTLTHAELVTIASALLLMGQGRDEIIATDSQASISMIAKYMDSPQILQQCKHKVMLEDIVAQLLAGARKGLQTRILKVKSHIGIRGNEEADKLATAATDYSTCS